MQNSKPIGISPASGTHAKRRRELVLIICIAMFIATVCSHFMVSWLKMKASWGYHNFGATAEKAPAILCGSSVAFSGIDWHLVSEKLGNPIESWAIPGSTPSEWEQMYSRSVHVSRTVVVISPADLNEYALCDFRAEIVPLGRTVVDLWHVKADMPFWKRVLSQYPIRAVRILFPTVGRSDGVMTGIRDKLKKLTKGESGAEAGEAFVFAPEGGPAPEEKVSEWSAGRLQRRMAATRAACQGKQSFDGLKKAATMRLLQKAQHQGEVIWIVMPLSPFYQDEFLTSAVKRDFERELLDLQYSSPRAKLIRLDQLPVFQDNGLFADFVHLNSNGQKIATRALLEQLGNQL